MHPTRYARARTLQEAAALFAGEGEAAYLAGGHTLLPAMKNRLAAPERLIDLRPIRELHGIGLNGGTLRVGAAATHAEVARSDIVRRAIPTLAALAGSIGDMQVRHMGTIGGSLANNDPAADYPAAVLGLGARVVTDRRMLDPETFFDGLYGTSLDDGEIITHIEFPVPAAAGYAKFRNPASRYALVAAFVVRSRLDGVRVAITGAGSDGVFRWARAESALEGAFEARALENLAPPAEDMLEDMHATAEERAHLVRSMTRQAVKAPDRATIFQGGAAAPV